MQSRSDGEGPRHRWQDYDTIKQEVVVILIQNPNGMTGAKIAELVGITQGAMSKYLSMLSVDGVISSRKVGVAKLWKLVSNSQRTDLLAEKLGSASVNFKDYVVSLMERNGIVSDPDDKRVMVMPTALLLNLYKYTQSIVGSEVHPFFYEWGKSYAREMQDLVDNMAQKTGKNFIESFLTLLRLKGWGKFDVRSFDKNSIEVVWHDSIWAELQTQDQTPVDDFMAGAITEAASLSFGGNWRFSEVECRSLGASNCRFIGKNGE